jgi:hypothetical protein
MPNPSIHPSISSKYEITAGFAQVILIPKLGVRDLGVTPLHAVEKFIQSGTIKGLKKIEATPPKKEISKTSKK